MGGGGQLPQHQQEQHQQHRQRQEDEEEALVLEDETAKLVDFERVYPPLGTCGGGGDDVDDVDDDDGDVDFDYMNSFSSMRAIYN